MGVDTRRPPLPASTSDSEVQRESEETEIDFGTDLSRRTDKTSISIPENGDEITIPVKKRKDKRDKNYESRLTRGPNKSQTSLLIEYFEGGKGPNVHARPSVRVKVTPSAARKIQDTNEHIQVTESKGSRKPSYTRRISLGPHGAGDRQSIEAADDRSNSSYLSAEEESGSHRYPPVEIEVLHGGTGSDLSGASTDRAMMPNASEISSMPPDSMLEERAGNVTPRRSGSRSGSRDAVVATKDTLKTPSRRRSRSLSKERIAHKAMEKLAGKTRESSSGKHRRSSKSSRTRSVSSEHLESLKSPRRNSSRHHADEELGSAADSSVVTNRQSGDQYSFRSGTSKSSINANPRLLETVENAIRRMIMPELENLKQEQKMQKSRHKFEQDSTGSTSSLTREEMSRKLSKHASAPDVVGKPKVVLNRDENNVGTVLSGDSIKGRKESRRARKSDSPSERRSEREISEETVIRDGGKSSRRSSKEGHRLRDGAAGAIAGGILTAAALNHHDLKHNDSRSSIDRKERRRRRSKSHSRSASLADTEEIFNKHDVPPMPMRSDIHSSDLTRDSILSDNTVESIPTLGEARQLEIQHVTRDSPREVLSPASRTPTRTPVDLRKGLGTYHSNYSRGDISEQSPLSDRSFRDEDSHSREEEASMFGATGAGAGALAQNHLPGKRGYEDTYAYSHQNRGLSPIQSVSSGQESEAIQDSFRHKHSSGSLASLQEHQRRKSASSAKSMSSGPSLQFDRSNRPKGMNLEPAEDVLDQHRLRELDYSGGSYHDKDPALDEWFQKEHEKNDRYRDSGDSTVDYKHMTNYTDDSMDVPHLDQVTAGQEKHILGVGRNPEWRSTPIAVESAVASLHDSSVLSARSKQGGESYTNSHEEHGERNSAYQERDVKGSRSGEQFQESYNDQPEEQARAKHSFENTKYTANESPRQSIARSLDEQSEPVHMGTSGIPNADDPMPEIGHGINSESEKSEISTNPSIIQGPLGGTQAVNRDPWQFQPATAQPKGDIKPTSKDSSAHQSLKAAAAGFLSAAAANSQEQVNPTDAPRSRELSMKDDYQPKTEDTYGVNDDFGAHENSYMRNPISPSPGKDEGYISGPQRGAPSPEIAFKDAKGFNDDGLDDLVGEDDPFVGQSHARHLSTNSGLAHGMGSPLYDSATGGGLDRIQSKDIVALMDHLTVRDAQRNARDTEILVTLVRSAAEMRNSFEEMKKFIAEQDDVLVNANNKQHDRTIQKIIMSGPRPQPSRSSKYTQRSPAEDADEDTPNKKRNVFRRALKGLSSRNQNDISKIEEMLEHLLGEVEGLKGPQDPRSSAAEVRRESLDSYNNKRATGPDGYEPEVPTSKGATEQSGYFTNSPSRGPSAMRGLDTRQGSQNRVSTVLEADEELDEHEQKLLDHQFENSEQLLTPTREYPRGGSVPLDTPPRMSMPTGAQSTENTPRTGTENGRKHKSGSSSFIPKISRWSKTTASSFGDNFRNNGKRETQLSEASRSGELQNYDNEDHYDPAGDDRLQSNHSIEDQPTEQENRPPSPLIPSQVSDDPKYQAHRNSLNLQHPQPRQGPTHRYQTHLESEAQNYGSRSPISPTSDSFGSAPAMARFNHGNTNRYSGGAGNLSPISDAGYSETSSSVAHADGPPRPPKIKDDGPLIPSTAGPSRPPKLATKDNRPTFASPLSTEHLQPEQRYSNGSGYDSTKGSPRSASGAVPTRKPTGPRPIVSSGSYSPSRNDVERKRYRGSPNHVESSSEDVTF